MSENSGGTSGVCKHCGATLPTAIASFCGNCGKPQQEIKSCIRCNFLLPAKAAFCFECGQNQSEQLQRKPCMLCQTVLPINAQHCIFCSAPQDFGILRTLNLKECNNQQCSILMMPELQICYKCRAPQQVMPVVHNQSQQSGESVPLSPQSGVGTFLGIQQTQSPEVLIQTATPLPSVTPPMNPPLQQSALQLSPIVSLTDNEKEQYGTTFAHTTTTSSPHYSPSLMDAEEDPSQKLNTSPITLHMTPTSFEPVTPQKALLSSTIKRSSDSNDYIPEGKKKKTDKNTSVGTCEETNVFKEKGGAVVRQKLSETNDSGHPDPMKDPTYAIHGDESNNERSQIPSDDVTDDHEMPKHKEKIIPNQNLTTPDSVNTVSHPNNSQAPIRQSVEQEKDVSSVPSDQENNQAHAHTDVLNREKAEAQRKFIKEKISESYVTSEEHGIMIDDERTETQDQNLERKRKQEETEGDLIPSSKNIINSESVNSYTPDSPDPLDNPPSNPPDTPPSNPPDTSPSDPPDNPLSDPPDNPLSDPPDTPPSDPQNTPPSDPQNTLPSDPPDSPPSDPSDTSPLDLQNTPLSDPQNNPPSDPQNTPLSDPQNISPSDPQNNSSSDPPDNSPSDPQNTPPSNPQNTPPSDPQNTLPSDPQDSPPSDPPDTSPLDPQNTPLSDPQNNPPSDPQNTPLSDPQNNPPSDPQNTPLSDPQNISPSDPQNNPSSDPPDNSPSDPQNTPPSDPQNTPPSNLQDTPPSDPPLSDPSPPPDPNISGQREEVPDPLSTPEIDPQTYHQVTQTPEDNVDPNDPNSSTFIAQASDSDSSPMPSPNKQDLKTPVQEVNDTNELHLGPNTTPSQTSEVEKHNDEKKTKEIKTKTGDEQKKEKQNSSVQPTKVKDDQGNASTVDKGKEKRGQKKEMK